MADEIDPTLKKIAPMLREAREMSAKLHDQLLAIEQVMSGIDPSREAVAWWEDNWRAKYRTGYLWNHARDKGQIKRLLKSMTVHEMKARMSAYLSSDERFHVQNQHPFGAFIASINSWGGRVKPRPVGCYHEPACEDDVQHTRRRQADARA